MMAGMPSADRPTRRRFLQQSAALSALSALPLRARRHGAGSLPVPTAQTPQATLRDAGSAKGIATGCAVQSHRLRDTPEYAALVRQQAGIIVGENEFKFGPLRPTPDTFFFDDADYLLHFAETNNIKLRGHNFVWHQALPAWFAGYVTPQNAEHLLIDHIERVAGRYKGKIHSWDVVNEAIQVSDGLPGGLRNSPWQRLLPGYIDLAFRTARRVDPEALLVYNDYGIEAEDAPSSAKRAAVLALVRDMKKRGVPIDAVGIQSHLTAGPTHVYGASLRKFMAEVHALGLRILLTEMDVNDRELPAEVPARDAAVAAVYADYLQATLDNPSICALLTWGITDRFTWLNYKQSRKDGHPERCLPFDDDLKPTPAFHAEIEALQHAAPRWRGHRIMT